MASARYHISRQLSQKDSALLEDLDAYWHKLRNRIAIHGNDEAWPPRDRLLSVSALLHESAVELKLLHVSIDRMIKFMRSGGNLSDTYLDENRPSDRTYRHRVKSLIVLAEKEVKTHDERLWNWVR